MRILPVSKHSFNLTKNVSFKEAQKEDNKKSVSDNNKKYIGAGIAAAAVLAAAVIIKHRWKKNPKINIKEETPNTIKPKANSDIAETPVNKQKPEVNEINNISTADNHPLKLVTNEELTSIRNNTNARERIKVLYGDIPTDAEELKNFVNRPWYTHKGHKIPDLPLSEAAAFGDNELVKLFLEHGADINHAGVSNATALHHAISNNQNETVKLLVEHGADINAIFDKSIKTESVMYSGENKNVIDLAAENGNNELIEFFLSKGAKINENNNNIGSPLILAANEGNINTVKLLLEKGCDINKQDCLQQTALYKAARNGHTELVKFLIEKGADINIKSDIPMTAFQAAASNGKIDILEVLMQHGADINGNAENGTALDWAISITNKNAYKTVEFLIKNGADVNIINYKHNTALDTALRYKQSKIARLLIENGAQTFEELQSVKA